MTPREILIEAARREIRLIPNGPYLRMEAVDEVDPAFEAILIRNKPALMRLIKRKRHLAVQVIAGEFCGCNHATFHSVLEDLGENPFDPICCGAIDHLKSNVRPTNHR
jgi:hypothetical protein